MAVSAARQKAMLAKNKRLGTHQPSRLLAERATPEPSLATEKIAKTTC